MIELAPNSKRGLELRGPLMLASGGYGSEFDPELLAHAHAFVTLPTTLRPRAPALAATRLVEFPGGFLLKRSGANPGLAAVLRAQRHFWPKLDLPIILTLGSADIEHWGELAQGVSRVKSISALELEVREEMSALDAVVTVKAQTDLPVLARLPLERTLELAEAVLQAGADALTVGRAPRGMTVVDGKTWYGRMMGPAVLPLALHAVRQVAARFPEIPLVGAGGIQSASDARAFLMAGARAVEIDTALWREPKVFIELAEEMEKSGGS